MTVAELIQYLRQEPPDSDVLLLSENDPEVTFHVDTVISGNGAVVLDANVDLSVPMPPMMAFRKQPSLPSAPRCPYTPEGTETGRAVEANSHLIMSGVAKAIVKQLPIHLPHAAIVGVQDAGHGDALRDIVLQIEHKDGGLLTRTLRLE